MSVSRMLGWRGSSGGARTSRANSCSSTERPTAGSAPSGSTDVNAYLAEHGNVSMSAKSFRTWNATVLAAEGFVQAADDDGEPSARVVNEVIDQVAGELGNTRAVCRASYVHPAIVTSYLDGTLVPQWRRPVGTKTRRDHGRRTPSAAPAEAAPGDRR